MRECEEINTDFPVLYRIPKELYRIVDYIFKNGKKEKGLFSESGIYRFDKLGDENELIAIREALDTGAEFPSIRYENIFKKSIHSMCETLLLFLKSLENFIIPLKLIPSKPIEEKLLPQYVNTLLTQLQTPNINVLLYIISFLRELIADSSSNEISSDMIGIFYYHY